MNDKNQFYSKYFSSHTSFFGKPSIEKIKNKYPVWKFYYSKFLPKNKNAKILDVGTGEGGFVNWLQAISYRNSFGIDISKEEVEIGKKMGIKSIKHEDVFEFLQEKINSYDIIFARDFLEHFEKNEIITILELFYNSLKPKGKLVIKVPNAEGPFGTHYLYSDFTHEIAFTERSLNQIFKIVGFKKVYCYPTSPPSNRFSSLGRSFLWKIIEFLLSFITFAETGSSKGIFTRNIISIALKKDR